MGASKRKSNDKSPAGDAVHAWSVRRRVIVTALLVIHLMAVVAAPFSNPPPASELSRTIAGVFRPYLHAAFLYHGYRFFAPNPGPSRLVLYELDMPDGTTVRGQFPDIERHWPRLLYHRHFMLSESVFVLTEQFFDPDRDEAMRLALAEARTEAEQLRRAGQGESAERLLSDAEREMKQYDEDRLNDKLSDRIMEDVNDQARRAAERLRAAGHDRQADRVLAEAEQDMREYEQSKRRKDLLLRSVARNLVELHGATRVRLYVQTHLIPPPIDVETGISLNDARYYTEPKLIADLSEDDL